MDMPFKPSLQHMCTVKIAHCLFNNSEIEEMRDEVNALLFNADLRTQSFKPMHEHWNKIEKLALKKVHFLPRILRTKVVSLLRPMAQQVEYWLHKHAFIERGDLDHSLKRMICWKMDGSVDSELTAKKIVLNLNLDRKIRYCIAIIYFMEKEIFDFCNEDPLIIFTPISTKAARFWIPVLLSDRKRHWTDLIRSYDFRQRKLERVSGFFRFLPRDARLHCSQNLRFPNSDDLQCCLCQIDEQERLELFEFDPNLLSSLLQWPLQIYFIDMANKLWSFMTVTQFEVILKIILGKCILMGLQDYDYLQLLRDFWRLSPSSFKEAIENQPIFQTIMVALNYKSETETLSLPEVLEAQRNIVRKGSTFQYTS